MPGTVEYYDKTAGEWARRGYADDAELSCLREFLSLMPPGGRVLDLCCGTGYESGRIRLAGFDAVGLDLSAACLKIARERNRDIPFFQGNLLEDYSYIGPVDGILLSAGLVHVESRELSSAFQRMGQVLKSGGYALVTVLEGMGKRDDYSMVEIDGQAYDRNFIAHTLEELTAASRAQFTYLRELSSDLPAWHSYLFQKTPARV